ncbi:zinc-ribbon domain-containing protein [Paenibacillus xylanilyticus]|uniref:Zinc-ribbon domain-containing protein n=1 Tax=Paenibacillus xylanilyticus TaxID=248903 RepID=A0A7Y6BRZ6_9BACL|nr:hypothetical protein [Paenibacillus xylanilyticus]
MINSLQNTHIHLVKEWNLSKTDQFLPEEVTADSHRRVWWKCTSGHEEFNPIRIRVRNNGCIQCKREAKRILEANKELDKNPLTGTFTDLIHNPNMKLIEVLGLPQDFTANISIESLYEGDDEFDRRIYLSLKRYGLDTVDQILQLTYNKLDSIRNLGERSQIKLYTILKSKFCC